MLKEQVISHEAMTKAIEKANKTNQNVVIFLAKINGDSEKPIEMNVTVTKFEACENKENLEVLGIIDTNGDFVE